MREIRVGRRGDRALVDDADYEKLRKHTWQIKRSKGGSVYAAWEFYVSGRRVRMLMHRMILELGPGEICDHRDGNGLNNQRSNLRHCSHAENIRNQVRKRQSAANPYKGVHKRSGHWAAIITIKGHQKCIGVYATPELAAHAYDDAARKHFGEFAKPNFGLPPQVNL